MGIDAFIGEISMVAFDFAPQGWMFCNGTELNISEHMALYTVIGKRYGGNGTTTFKLPDLQGRMPVGVGMQTINDKRNPFPLAQAKGQAIVSLTINNLPAHYHNLLNVGGKIIPQATIDKGNVLDPSDAIWANTEDSSNIKLKNFSNDSSATKKDMKPIDVKFSGETGKMGLNDPFEIMNPYLALNFIICVDGLYPMRPG